MRIPQIKARGLLLLWGKIRFIYGYSTFYVGLLQLLLIALTAYNTTIREWAKLYLHVDITFWQYGLVLFASVLLGLFVEYIITVPALIAISNEQMYKHDSPIKTDFEDVKKAQKQDGERLDRIEAELRATNTKLEALLREARTTDKETTQ